MRRGCIGLALSVVLGIALVGGPAAWADPINPGFDLLHTPPGGGILPPIDQLDLGPTPLKGVPISPVLGNTDTIVERKTGLPAGGTGPIAAEIVALNLKSVEPVLIRDSFFDVFVTLDNRPAPLPTDRVQNLLDGGGGKLNPSTGTITITMHDDANGGGTFDSLFHVFSKTIFKEVGGDIVLGPFFREDDLSSTGTPWSHTCAPGLLCLPDGTLFDLPTGDPPFTAGNFFLTPAGIVHVGPHPQNVPSTPTPIPSTLLLLGVGLAGFGAAARMRRK